MGLSEIASECGRPIIDIYEMSHGLGVRVKEPQMWYDVVSAISNLVMAAFAVIAGIYAKGQYDEAKQQRELALRQEQEERRKEAKQDELALQQQQHERELIEAHNRALFLERCILSTRRVPSYRGEVDRVTGRYVAGLSWLGLSGRWFLGYCMRAWVLR